MSQNVSIRGIGVVAFPDDMSFEEVRDASRKLLSDNLAQKRQTYLAEQSKARSADPDMLTQEGGYISDTAAQGGLGILSGLGGLSDAFYKTGESLLTPRSRGGLGLADIALIPNKIVFGSEATDQALMDTGIPGYFREMSDISNQVSQRPEMLVDPSLAATDTGLSEEIGGFKPLKEVTAAGTSLLPSLASAPMDRDWETRCP